MQVLLALGTNWGTTGSVAQYAQWCNTSAVGFFSDPGCIQMFQAHMGVVTSRVNTINGRRSACLLSCSSACSLALLLACLLACLLDCWGTLRPEAPHGLLRADAHAGCEWHSCVSKGFARLLQPKLAADAAAAAAMHLQLLG